MSWEKRPGQTRREKAASASRGEASADSGPAHGQQRFEKGRFCCVRHLLLVFLEQPWGLNTQERHVSQTQ